MTQDILPNWFLGEPEQNFKSMLLESGVVPKKILQIGAYTGDASLWLYNNILKNSPDGTVLIDVDTWQGSQEFAHEDLDWETIENIYDARTRDGRFERKIIKYKGTSDSFFRNNREQYDFIYIDGDHTAYGVMKDAVSAYESLRIGGLIGFDDYQWIGKPDPVDRPEPAIRAFLEIYKKRVEVVVRGYQLWVRKIG